MKGGDAGLSDILETLEQVFRIVSIVIAVLTGLYKAYQYIKGRLEGTNSDESTVK